MLFDELKAGLAAPLAGMGLSFSSSLFGIAGSLILGFLDLQVAQAQRRFRNEIESWPRAPGMGMGMSMGTTEVGPQLVAGDSLSYRFDRLSVVDVRRRRPTTAPRRRRWPIWPKASGPRAAHARRAADDPRLGRGAGRAREGPEARHRPPRLRLGRITEP